MGDHVVKRRLLSAFVIVTLMASVLAGAIGVSVDLVKASASDSDIGIFSQLIEEARLDCPENRLSEFRSITDNMYNNFNNYLIIVITDEANDSWYIVAYAPRTNYQLIRWSDQAEYSDGRNQFYRFRGVYNNNGNNSVYGMQRVSVIKMTGGNRIQYSSTNTYIDWANIRNNINWTDTSLDYGLSPTICNVEGRKAFSNQDIYYLTETNTWDLYWSTNLYPDPLIPDPVEFSWFKFNLGDRWYVTTNDQSLVNNLYVLDEEQIVWFIRVYQYDEILGESYYDSLVLSASDLTRLSYAQDFITQTLTNVDPAGVFAYDITDLINNPELVSLKDSYFQMWYVSPDYDSWPLYLVGESDDVVSLVLTPNEENPARNEAWTIINNYIENYPSVTISPAALAPQLSGQTAIAGGMGWLQVPSALYDWAVNTNRINDYDPSLTDDFEFRLNSESLSPTEMSLINYDILDAVVLAADAVGSVTDPYLHYWMAENSLSAYFVDRMSYQECLDSFDIILIVKNNSWFLGNVYDNLSAPDFALTQGTYSYTNLHKNQLMPVPSTTAIDNSVYYCYWILTPRAIQKSQLFAFCDGFHKLYNLACEYVEKKDLWDNSFFEWSMSIFYQLESINGYLSNVQSKLDTVISSLQRLEQNTSETDVEPWYLSLLNWVRRFPVTDLDFVRWVNNYDTFQDSLEYPETTVIPLPTTVPTSAVGG